MDDSGDSTPAPAQNLIEAGSPALSHHVVGQFEYPGERFPLAALLSASYQNRLLDTRKSDVSYDAGAPPSFVAVDSLVHTLLVPGIVIGLSGKGDYPASQNSVKAASDGPPQTALNQF